MWLDNYSDSAEPSRIREPKPTPYPGPGELLSESLGCSASRMEKTRAVSGGGHAGAEFPMEPLESQVPILEPLQVPAEQRPPESPESGPATAVPEAAAAGQDLAGRRRLPSPRPAGLRVLPPSLGYGAFRRQTSASPELPSRGRAAAEQPRDGEAAGAELVPWAAPGEPAPGAWAPVELQVDVRVKPVGAAGGSCAPSPAPSTRFIAVPVPESPAFSRHAAPAYPLLQRTASTGSTWGRGAQLPAARAERGLDAEGGAESPGSPTCRCRCKERGLEKERAVLLPRAEVDGDKKLHRAIRLIGKGAQARGMRAARSGASQPEAPQHPPSAGPP